MDSREPPEYRVLPAMSTWAFGLYPQPGGTRLVSRNRLAGSGPLFRLGMIGFMALFAYLYLYGRNPGMWSSPPPIGQTALILLLEAGAFAAAWGGRRVLAGRKGQVSGDLPWMLQALAAALLVGALWLDISGWLATGLAPTHNGMGATVFMLAALQGQVVVVAVIMATYLAFREARGLLSTPTNVTMDIVARFIGFAAAQGVIFTLVPRVFPGG